MRGRSGGLTLVHPPEAIRVGNVFHSLTACPPSTACLSNGENTCPLTAACQLKARRAGALESFYSALDQITIDDLVADNRHLETLLKVA